MGVPFEALLPYGVMLAVRLHSPSTYLPDPDMFIDVRILWSWSRKD